MKRFAAAGLVASLFATTPAQAEPPRTKRVWYGYQTLVADAVSLGCMTAALASKTDNAQAVLVVTSLTTFVVAPGVIHGIHDRPFVGLGDAAMRLLGPSGLALTGAAIGLAFDDERTAGATASVGLLGGIVAAIVIDAAVLAWETVPRDEESSKPALRFTPSFVATSTTLGAGLSASF